MIFINYAYPLPGNKKIFIIFMQGTNIPQVLLNDILYHLQKYTKVMISEQTEQIHQSEIFQKLAALKNSSNSPFVTHGPSGLIFEVGTKIITCLADLSVPFKHTLNDNLKNLGNKFAQEFYLDKVVSSLQVANSAIKTNQKWPGGLIRICMITTFYQNATKEKLEALHDALQSGVRKKVDVALQSIFNGQKHFRVSPHQLQNPKQNQDNKTKEEELSTSPQDSNKDKNDMQEKQQKISLSNFGSYTSMINSLQNETTSELRNTKGT